MPSTTPWWRSAVIYQVYVRSFADGNADGVGDLAGIRSRLPYLKSLGVDALWINPWYKSPMADGGYDVADYRAIDPLFGTLAEAEQLIADAHRHGIRIIPDIVPNHTSDQHAWFQAALAAGPGSPERERYIFRPGRGPGGAAPSKVTPHPRHGPPPNSSPTPSRQRQPRSASTAPSSTAAPTPSPAATSTSAPSVPPTSTTARS